MIPCLKKIGAGVINSVALLHFDGGNGSTVFTDVYGHTLTGHGSIAQSNTQVKFGASSCKFTSSGGAQYLTTPDSTDWHFAGDFTVEFWVYFNTLPSNYQVLCGADHTGAGAWIDFTYDYTVGKMLIRASNSSGSWGFTSTSPSVTTGQWYHVAIVRSSGTVTSYLNGTSIASGALSGTIYTSGDALTIGAQATSGSFPITDGYIDEFRISPVARYTSNFTPSGPFTF